MKLETYPFLFTFNKNQFINTTTILERLSRKPHNLFTPHRTEFHMIYLFTNGNGKHMVDFNSLEVKQKHILFITQGQVHCFDPAETYDGKALVFTESFFCRSDRNRDFLRNSILFNSFQQPYFDTKNNFRELKSLFEEIYKELKRPFDKYQGELLHNLLYRILLLSERCLEQQLIPEKVDLRTVQLITRFKQLVDQSYKTQRHVKFYAEKLAVSTRTLQLATSEVLGKTPKEWIADRILLEAKRILAYETLSIKELGAQMNFSDTTNFVKFFKKKTEMTPARFRSHFSDFVF